MILPATLNQSHGQIRRVMAVVAFDTINPIRTQNIHNLYGIQTTRILVEAGVRNNCHSSGFVNNVNSLGQFWTITFRIGFATTPEILRENFLGGRRVFFHDECFGDMRTSNNITITG